MLGEAFLIDLPDAPENTKLRDRVQRLLALAGGGGPKNQTIASSAVLAESAFLTPNCATAEISLISDRPASCQNSICSKALKSLFLPVGELSGANQ